MCSPSSCRINLDGKTRLNTANSNGLIGLTYPNSQLMTEAPISVRINLFAMMDRHIGWFVVNGKETND